MDINEALARARDIADQIDNGEANETTAADLAEAFQNIDRWLSKGGFLPGAWSQRITRRQAAVGTRS
jgi:hypothetical protein